MITIVTGLPRSGTSLMMQMLEAAGIPILTDSVRAADESNPRGYYEFEKVKSLQKDQSWIQEADGKAVKIIVQLLPFLPGNRDYRFILMNRPIAEVIQSQHKMLERLGRTGASIPLEGIFAQQLSRAEQWLSGQSEVFEIDFHALLKEPQEQASRIASFLKMPESTIAMSQVIDPTLWRERTVP